MLPIDSFHSTVCTSEYLLHLMSLLLLIMPKFLFERDEFHLVCMRMERERVWIRNPGWLIC